MTEMKATDGTPRTEREDPPEPTLRSQEERDRRWAEIRAGRIPPDIASLPEMQELRRSHEEFRADIRAAVRKITGREPRWR